MSLFDSSSYIMFERWIQIPLFQELFLVQRFLCFALDCMSLNCRLRTKLLYFPVGALWQTSLLPIVSSARNMTPTKMIKTFNFSHLLNHFCVRVAPWPSFWWEKTPFNSHEKHPLKWYLSIIKTYHGDVTVSSMYLTWLTSHGFSLNMYLSFFLFPFFEWGPWTCMIHILSYLPTKILMFKVWTLSLMNLFVFCFPH